MNLSSFYSGFGYTALETGAAGLFKWAAFWAKPLTGSSVLVPVS